MEKENQHKKMERIYELAKALAQATRQSDQTIQRLFGVSKNQAIRYAAQEINDLASELN